MYYWSHIGKTLQHVRDVLCFLKNVQLQLPVKTDAWIFGRGRGNARLQRADFLSTHFLKCGASKKSKKVDFSLFRRDHSQALSTHIIVGHWPECCTIWVLKHWLVSSHFLASSLSFSAAVFCGVKSLSSISSTMRLASSSSSPRFSLGTVSPPVSAFCSWSTRALK